jgi:vancomycin resistance protein YoaR
MSLNDVLGERTEARGFVEAPMIADSLEVLAVGGGVSQVSTTLYNAAFEAGLDIPEHRAHGLYIGRYPLGRDATISWRDPDLILHNDWPHPVLIHAGVSADAITVSLYSRTDGRRVETTTSEPFDKTKPPERLIQNPDLDPKAKILVQSGSDGFSVEVTRTVYRDDEVTRSERFTTVYRPYPKIYAVGLEVPGGEPEPKAPES